MKYDLSDLKNVADELLDKQGIEINPYAAARIVRNAQNAVPVRRKAPSKRWLAVAAASVVTCAAAAVLIFTSSLEHLNRPVNQLAADSGGTSVAGAQYADATPMSAHLSESTAHIGKLDMQAPRATYNPDAAYEVVEADDGLFGVKAQGDDWLIEPVYDSGRIENGIAYMQKGGDIYEIPLGDE